MTNLEEVWFRPYVWTDYRLALLFNLIIPIVLTIWAFVQRVDCIQRLLAIYWRVASLAAITVYLMIGGFAVSFLSGLIARILIPLSIWFWVDLNDEVEYQSPGPLKLVFTSWRWAITVYGILGAIGTVPFLGCAFSGDSRNSAYCKVWTEAPLMFKDYFHHNSTPAFLGFLGIVGLTIYIIYLTYFVLVKFGKYGRTAVH